MCKPEDMPTNAVRLFATNQAVEFYNTKVINGDKNKLKVKAIVKISGNIEER